MRITRRSVLAIGALASGSGPTFAASSGAPQPTPAQAMGPFYPVVDVAESTADLTQRQGKTGAARGTPIHVTCTVLSVSGKPIHGAIVMIWQANAAGRYSHPRDSSAAPLDEHFVGHALLRTNKDGKVYFKTVKPGAYSDTPGTRRTPHIHYEVIGEEARLITQMYFPDEPLNSTDRLLREAAASGVDIRRLIASPARSVKAPDGAPMALEWSIVLEGS